MNLTEQVQTETTSPRRRTVWLLVALGLVLAFVAVLAFGLRPKTSTVLQGRPAPDFELTAFNGEFNGQRFSLQDMRGQIVVLNFWASWCVECDKEMPLLEQAWNDYRDQGVWLIGVDYLDIDSEGLAYLDRFGTTYPNGPDIGSRIFQDYQCTGVPETFFIDREGMIQHVQIGPLTQPQLYGLLDRLLAAETEG
ncbi:MAG: TlpA family protein disulfide reductase [Anaerolineales bacterium]|nr:MAG: TlpA family protein disulfide reductase [Anaerolineales bacterium]